MSELPVLPAGFSPVPAGHVATVVTYLAMHAPPPPAESRAPHEAAPAGLSLARLDGNSLARYRDVFRAVGTPWLWFSRLRLSDTALRGILAHEQVDAWAVVNGDRDVGLLELDFREAGECELAFFGLVPECVGQGVGRWLMHEATTRAWARPITRFHVHTCTLDHPRAVSFYVRSGFVPYKQAVEVAPDPRLDGTLPREAGAHVPLVPLVPN